MIKISSTNLTILSHLEKNSSADFTPETEVFDDLSIASEALEACISEFFENNLIAEKTPDARPISCELKDPIETMVGG